MSDAPAICPLDDFGILRFRGPDARGFLQGQLSSDITELAPGIILRAGLHSPQGRTVALLWLAADGSDILALLPLELAPTVAAHLRRYVLRAKVAIAEESAQHRLQGVRVAAAPALTPRAWRLTPERSVLMLAAGEAVPPGDSMSREQWRAIDISDGLPQVYAATSAQFIAQMLNLDCIGAVSFGKGCYTGQEVIARAHYRGRVKRRLQRFESLVPQALKAGDAGRLEDGRSYRVIEAVQRADGCSEFLAVAPLPGAVRDSEEGAPAAPVQTLKARALALPYPLPE